MNLLDMNTFMESQMYFWFFFLSPCITDTCVSKMCVLTSFSSCILLFRCFCSTVIRVLNFNLLCDVYCVLWFIVISNEQQQFRLWKEHHIYDYTRIQCTHHEIGFFVANLLKHSIKYVFFIHIKTFNSASFLHLLKHLYSHKCLCFHLVVMYVSVNVCKCVCVSIRIWWMHAWICHMCIDMCTVVTCFHPLLFSGPHFFFLSTTRKISNN